MNESQSLRKVLVLVEEENGKVASVTLEVLGLARRLADSLQGNLCATVIGYETRGILEEIAYFADEVYSTESPLLADFQVDLYASVFENLSREVNPVLILMGHTLNNRELGPKLAYRLGAELITDCVDLDIDQRTNALLCTKPVYGGNVIATFKVESKPGMATVRPKATEPIRQSKGRGQIIDFNPVIDKSSVRTLLIERVIEESASLDKADAVVAGGRGIKEIEGLKELQELIHVMKRRFDRVELGASRPLVDRGWVSSSRQIGLTGEKVAPELYIAVGISGASQHLAGILGSKKVIAINSDPEAPIFKAADYGVIGKYKDAVPALVKKLEELL